MYGHSLQFGTFFSNTCINPATQSIHIPAEQSFPTLFKCPNLILADPYQSMVSAVRGGALGETHTARGFVVATGIVAESNCMSAGPLHIPSSTRLIIKVLVSWHRPQPKNQDQKSEQQVPKESLWSESIFRVLSQHQTTVINPSSYQNSHHSNTMWCKTETKGELITFGCNAGWKNQSGSRPCWGQSQPEITRESAHMQPLHLCHHNNETHNNSLSAYSLQRPTPLISKW